MSLELVGRTRTALALPIHRSRLSGRLSGWWACGARDPPRGRSGSSKPGPPVCSCPVPLDGVASQGCSLRKGGAPIRWLPSPAPFQWARELDVWILVLGVRTSNLSTTTGWRSGSGGWAGPWFRAQDGAGSASMGCRPRVLSKVGRRWCPATSRCRTTCQAACGGGGAKGWPSFTAHRWGLADHADRASFVSNPRLAKPGRRLACIRASTGIAAST